MFGKGNDEVQDIRKAEFIRNVRVQDKCCTICIEDALVGTVDGKNIYLDEELVNEMIHDIVRTEAPTYSIDENVLKEIENKNAITQEFTYSN